MKSIIAALVVLIVGVGCSTPKTVYESVYKATDCKQPITRDRMVEALMKKGFYYSSSSKAHYDIFHKPQITKKGALAVDPYEEKAGDILVAVCGLPKGAHLITEEVRGCENQKSCTIEQQKELKNIAESFGCKVEERAGFAHAWNMRDRQDWTQDSCDSIVKNLSF